MEMGFPEDVCVEALERYDGDEQLALNFLLGGWVWEDKDNESVTELHDLVAVMMVGYAVY